MRPAILLALVLLAPLAAAPGGAQIHAHAGMFAPDDVSVGAREPVLFVNGDGRAHTVTSAWDDGKAVNVVLMPGESVRISFEQPGDYAFRCVPHSTLDGGAPQGMVVTVHVAGATARSADTRILVVGAGLIAVLFLAAGGGALGLTRRRARR